MYTVWSGLFTYDKYGIRVLILSVAIYLSIGTDRSDQGLQCLPLIEQFLDNVTETDLVKFLDK